MLTKLLLPHQNFKRAAPSHVVLTSSRSGVSRRSLADTRSVRSFFISWWICNRAESSAAIISLNSQLKTVAGTDRLQYSHLAAHDLIEPSVVTYKRDSFSQRLPKHFEHEYQKTDMLV